MQCGTVCTPGGPEESLTRSSCKTVVLGRAAAAHVSRVFVFEEYSIGFPISAGIPNTSLMSAHLLIAVAYLCRFN